MASRTRMAQAAAAREAARAAEAAHLRREREGPGFCIYFNSPYGDICKKGAADCYYKHKFDAATAANQKRLAAEETKSRSALPKTVRHPGAGVAALLAGESKIAPSSSIKRHDVVRECAECGTMLPEDHPRHHKYCYGCFGDRTARSAVECKNYENCGEMTTGGPGRPLCSGCFQEEKKDRSRRHEEYKARQAARAVALKNAPEVKCDSCKGKVRYSPASFTKEGIRIPAVGWPTCKSCHEIARDNTTHYCDQCKRSHGPTCPMAGRPTIDDLEAEAEAEE